MIDSVIERQIIQRVESVFPYSTHSAARTYPQVVTYLINIVDAYERGNIYMLCSFKTAFRIKTGIFSPLFKVIVLGGLC